jgi:hypothetical protein
MYRKDLVFIGVDKHESKNNKEQEIKSDTSAQSTLYFELQDSQVEEYNILTIWLIKW